MDVGQKKNQEEFFWKNWEDKPGFVGNKKDHK